MGKRRKEMLQAAAVSFPDIVAAHQPGKVSVLDNKLCAVLDKSMEFVENLWPKPKKKKFKSNMGVVLFRAASELRCEDLDPEKVSNIVST